MTEYIPSRFVRKTLLPNEKCVAEGRFSWLYSFQAWTSWILWLCFGGMLQYLFYRYLGVDTIKPVLFCGGIGMALCISMLMRLWTTEILMTTERLIYKRGFFNIEMQEVDIEQLASDNVVQGFLGRMFDYGEIHVRCIEAADIYLPAITHPYEFRNTIEQQKKNYREHYMKVERLRHHGEQPSDNI